MANQRLNSTVGKSSFQPRRAAGVKEETTTPDADAHAARIASNKDRIASSEAELIRDHLKVVRCFARVSGKPISESLKPTNGLKTQEGHRHDNAKPRKLTSSNHKMFSWTLDANPSIQALISPGKA
jgi:hypothetical protein